MLQKISLLIYLLAIQLVGLAQFVSLNKIVASDRQVDDNFGYEVAIDDDVAVVGAPLEDEDVTGGSFADGAGAAYIYERDTSGFWTEVQKIVAADRSFGDGFGSTVALSGNTIIVGAWREAEDSLGLNNMPNAGSVYVFQKAGGLWSQTQKLNPSDRATNDQFGYSLAIDGDLAIIGAFGEDEDPTGGTTLALAGSAYIFEAGPGGSWSEVQKVVASDRGLDDRFGLAVDISGSYAVVGAHREDEDELGGAFINDAGSAYLFESDVAGNWSEVKKLVAADRGNGDNFGYDVAIDGNYCVIGAELEDHDSAGLASLDRAGSAYVFERNVAGDWTQADKLVASDRALIDRFARSVDISGNYIAIGAYWEDEDAFGLDTKNNSGSAYLFEKMPSGNWAQLQKIVAADRSDIDWFGHSVAISNGAVIVGAYLESEDTSGMASLLSAGSAYLFQGALDLDSCSAVDTTLSISSCDSYISPSGLYNWTVSGLYQDTLMSALGCDSVLSIDLNIPVIETTVTVSGATLSASPGFTYQWLACPSLNPISGATMQLFTPAASGSYAVVVSDAGCSDTSLCSSVQVVGVEEISIEHWKVYPNPTANGRLQIKAPPQQNPIAMDTKAFKLIIYDVLGQPIVETNLAASELALNLEIETGVYLLHITKEGRPHFSKKIIKQ